MLIQLLEFVNKQKLFQPDEQILLAVSSGIDSVVLTHLFHKARFNFSIAHCNFNLRASESDGDEEFVRSLAKAMRIQLFVKSFKTSEYAKKQGISIQMSARELRRQWFSELLKSNSFSKIATAHHLNDSLETVLFNLAKGTGIAGLQGISPAKDQYVRPLLFATREMISQFAAANKLEWREDKSNNSTKYNRNLIRHNIIPELKKINPNLELTFSQTSEKMMASTVIYREVINRYKDNLLKQKAGVFQIAKKPILKTEEPTLVLFELIEGFGFNYYQAKNVIQNLTSQSGKVYYSPNYQLTVDREQFFISKVEEHKMPELEIDSDVEQINYQSNLLTFEKRPAEDLEIDRSSSVADLDLDLLQFPLKVRAWKHGDVFYPLGMKHKKKVSDFMIDEKIPLNLKKQTMTIFSGEDLVWLVGYRIDDRYKITKQTRNIFRICNYIRHD